MHALQNANYNKKLENVGIKNKKEAAFSLRKCRLFITKGKFFNSLEISFIPSYDRYEVNIVTDKEIYEIGEAIYTINRHVKTATNRKPLYSLKKDAIDKLLQDGFARKVGLQYVPRPKNSQQFSTLLIEVGPFLFHTKPTKKDFQQLPHLGDPDASHRNPKVRLNLTTAKKRLYEYLGRPIPKHPKQTNRKRYNRHTKIKRQIFPSSYLDG